MTQNDPTVSLSARHLTLHTWIKTSSLVSHWTLIIL